MYCLLLDSANKYLCVGTPFLFEEQFAGAVLKFKGEPYVRP